jgi:uncharacterized lipoprotein YddW (UPF0748 family)
MTPVLALAAIAGPLLAGVTPVVPITVLALAAAPPVSAPDVRSAARPDPTPAPEMRGLWVVRTALVSPETVDAVVDRAKAAGFNALFVQVRGRGDAFYRSRIVPRSLLLERQPPSFDPLARLLQRARARGLQVHAWLNVLLVAGFVGPLPAGHVATVHPDWLMVPREAAAAALAARPDDRPGLIRDAAGDIEGFYLSPSAPGVAEHLETVVRELLTRYAVDGVHLDFIRYPGMDQDYSLAALEGFHAPSSSGGVFRIAELMAGPANQPEAWSVYLRQRLTALTERLSRAARAERPEIVVSAAVVPDEAQAVYERYQDWPAWMAAGLLDALCPMAYTPDAGLFRQQLTQVRARVGPGKTVWAGVGAYRLTTPAVVDRILSARQAGAAGVVLFSHESLDPEALARLRTDAFVPAAGAGGWEGSAGRAPR